MAGDQSSGQNSGQKGGKLGDGKRPSDGDGARNASSDDGDEAENGGGDKPSPLADPKVRVAVVVGAVLTVVLLFHGFVDYRSYGRFQQSTNDAYLSGSRRPPARPRRNALFRLAVFTGRLPEARLPAAEACAAAPGLALPIPVGIGARLLARRPDVRQVERRLAADTYRIGIATADLYPSVSLGGNLSGAASDLAGLMAAAGRTWAVGPMLSLAFPNQAAIRARIRGPRGRAAADLAAFEGTVLGALRDVEQALSTEAADLDRLDALRLARARDAAAVGASQARFRAGAIGSLNAFDAQRTFIADEALLARADQQLAFDQVLLLKALGGGWRPYRKRCSQAT